MAVDWVSERMYWTDSGAGTIEMADLDGKNRLTILRENLHDVDKIVVEPNNG